MRFPLRRPRATDRLSGLLPAALRPRAEAALQRLQQLWLVTMMRGGLRSIMQWLLQRLRQRQGSEPAPPPPAPITWVKSTPQAPTAESLAQRLDQLRDDLRAAGTMRKRKELAEMVAASLAQLLTETAMAPLGARATSTLERTLLQLSRVSDPLERADGFELNIAWRLVEQEVDSLARALRH